MPSSSRQEPEKNALFFEKNSAILGIVQHFYRATVLHADVWRRRLDATTNWAVVTTAAIVTFAFSDVSHPHSALLFSIPFISLFILMESRRYQMYDMWRHRVRLLNRFFVAPALDCAHHLPPQRIDAELSAIAHQIGTSVPRLGILDAIGYRIRRNYGFLFTAILIIWFIKIWSHPEPLEDASELIARADVGNIPGTFTFVMIALFAGFVSFLAARAPTERMRDWHELAPPLHRLLHPNEKLRELSVLTQHERDALASREEGEPGSPP